MRPINASVRRKMEGDLYWKVFLADIIIPNRPDVFCVNLTLIIGTFRHMLSMDILSWKL